MTPDFEQLIDFDIPELGSEVRVGSTAYLHPVRLKISRTLSAALEDAERGELEDKVKSWQKPYATPGLGAGNRQVTWLSSGRAVQYEQAEIGPQQYQICFTASEFALFRADGVAGVINFPGSSGPIPLVIHSDLDRSLAAAERRSLVALIESWESGETALHLGAGGMQGINLPGSGRAISYGRNGEHFVLTDWRVGGSATST